MTNRSSKSAHATARTPSLFAAVLTAILLTAAPARSELRARVVDVGAGLCVVIENGDHVVLYDAGHWTGTRCKTALDAVMATATKKIDMVVFSHSDGDHVGNGAAILGAYAVDRVLHTGYRVGTTSEAYTTTLAAIGASGATDINLSKTPILPGATFDFGGMYVTFVAGWGSPPTEWGLSDNSHKNNAVSVIVRVVYAGKSILLGGDSYGRDIGDPTDACEAAEGVMVKRAAAIPLKSDVLVAPHHGADNASSSCFIKAIKPEFVIFSAGSKYEHPTAAAADRYLASAIGAVPATRIFRTDRGDTEGGGEWTLGSTGQKDSPGDDDVLITISDAGAMQVKYAQ